MTTISNTAGHEYPRSASTLHRPTTQHRPVTPRRPPTVTTAPRAHRTHRVVAAFLVMVASLGLVAALIPVHSRTAPVRLKPRPGPPAGTVSQPKTVSSPTTRLATTAPSAEQAAAQVAEAVVLGVAPPPQEVTAALAKILQVHPAVPVDLRPDTVSVSTVSVSAAGVDGTDQLFEVVVTPLDGGPVPVDVVVIETDGRPLVAALPGIAS